MHAGNGGAHMFGLRHKRLALVGVGKQAADAYLVIVIGALDGRHLVVHQQFQLGGARQHASTPSPMAATSRRMAWPTDITNSLARCLRLRQPQRHFGHGFGDRAHFLRAAHQVSKRVEADHGSRRDHGADGDGCARTRAVEQRLQSGRNMKPSATAPAIQAMVAMAASTKGVREAGR